MSKRQARWMFAKHPKMARRWAKHTKDVKSLPEFFVRMLMENDPVKVEIDVCGVPVCVEWLPGEMRKYAGGDYERLMRNPYGYIPDTVDADGEELDVYVGPDEGSDTAYVVKQLKPDGSFDENKVMLGFSSLGDAVDCYVYHMGGDSGAREKIGGIDPIPTSALRTLFGSPITAAPQVEWSQWPRTWAPDEEPDPWPNPIMKTEVSTDGSLKQADDSPGLIGYVFGGDDDGDK